MLQRRPMALFALMLVSLAVVAAPPSPARVVADSVYAIPTLALRDQQGQRFDFASLRGEPRLVGMFYGSCQMACPLEIEYLKHLQKAVAARSGQSIPVLLVSFDPARDDLAMLRKVAGEHRVRPPAFRLARAERGDEGMLAGVLGIAYRQLPGGGFSHNVRVSLLDAQGRIVATTDASGRPEPAFVQAIDRALAKP
ncbi:SCO family protein [Rhodanobacter ginsengisoli]|uniref:SCO family protein n=2 Tax=Rhodanobacter ginsengisoli TaxID=418646 RepID=A0ABW0QQA3_9GAMM